jgi:pimeloyl-ACP methyl ester carboxylesterase
MTSRHHDRKALLIALALLTSEPQAQPSVGYRRPTSAHQSSEHSANPPAAGGEFAAQEPQVEPAAAKGALLGLEPYTAELEDGSQLIGELGRLRVPVQHSEPTGPSLELAFVRFPSTAAEPGAPIYFLVGGPGASGIEFAAEMALDPAYGLLAQGDVIALDQRGTGLSEPHFDSGPSFEEELPLDAPLTRASLIAAQKRVLAQAVAHWRAQGVDVGAINTFESANDVELLRQSLGHAAIVPFGISYGSHLGLAYLRQHGQHVARAVLMKVEGPNHTFKLPSEAHGYLEQVAKLSKAAPELDGLLPDLLTSLKGILAQLAEQPRTLTTDRFGPPVSVVIGPYDVQLLVAYALGSSNTLATLPLALSLMEQGQFDHVLGFVMQNRIVDASNLMGLLMDCASYASPARLKQIEREALDATLTLSDALLAPLYPDVCAATSTKPLPANFRAPLKSPTPILFVSGSLDARTPANNVLELMPGLPNAIHLQIENTGHDSRENQSLEFQALLQKFLAGQSFPSQTLTLAPLEFRQQPPR